MQFHPSLKTIFPDQDAKTWIGFFWYNVFIPSSLSSTCKGLGKKKPPRWISEKNG